MGFWSVVRSWWCPSPLGCNRVSFSLLLAGIDDGRMSLQSWSFLRWMVKIDEGALMPREKMRFSAVVLRDNGAMP